VARRFLVEAEDSAGSTAELAGPTVREFLEDWLVQSAPTRRATTSASYECCVRDHVLPHLGEVRLCELTPERITPLVTLRVRLAPAVCGVHTLKPVRCRADVLVGCR
jgi:hypothetical protein